MPTAKSPYFSGLLAGGLLAVGIWFWWAFFGGLLDSGHFFRGLLDLGGFWQGAFGRELLEEGFFLVGNWNHLEKSIYLSYFRIFPLVVSEQ